MSYKLNPFTGKLDDAGSGGGGGGTPGGSTTQIQFNDGGSFGGDADLTWNKTTNVLTNRGDINLDDGGTYTTTVQCVTPTANRTISFPDATGTVALVAGASGQLLYNNAGANAGLSTSTVGATGNVSLTLNGAASTPPLAFTGTWFTGGTSTTTKPQVLIEPTGTTSTAWSTSGTGLGVNAASGFTGNLLDLQVNGTSNFLVSGGIVSRAQQLNLPEGVGSTGIQLALGGGANGVYLGSGLEVSWSAGSGTSAFSIFSSSRDLRLARDAANTLAQRNGTSAQTYRVYNTYTSSTNYELGKLEWSSNVFRIGTEKGSGGGTARTVEVHTDSIARLALDTTGSVRVVTGLTVATLPGTPTVGMIARVTDATAPAVGSTVAGGGAAAALCWYNGTNWTVIGV